MNELCQLEDTNVQSAVSRRRHATKIAGRTHTLMGAFLHVATCRSIGSKTSAIGYSFLYRKRSLERCSVWGSLFL